MSKQNHVCDSAEIPLHTRKLNQALINVASCQKHCALKLNSFDSKEITCKKSEQNGMTDEDRAFVIGYEQETIFRNNSNFNFKKVKQEMIFQHNF